MHIFQEQYLQWFKGIDAKDSKSPHWYNPLENFSTSRQAVSPDQVPHYTEQIAPFGNRIHFISGYLIAMVTMIAVLFVLSFLLFVRYDMR